MGPGAVETQEPSEDHQWEASTPTGGWNVLDLLGPENSRFPEVRSAGLVSQYFMSIAN